jgi:predicted Zn-dependent protease
MMVRAGLRCCIFMVCCCAGYAAGVTRDEVVAGAEQLYRARISDAQSRYQLDNDPAFLARVHRIANGLIVQAERDNATTKEFKWEIHVTDAVDESASCMAGGKLLIGQPYVVKLGLSDAELAMLLSHEIQHAVLEHNFKEFEEALRLQPARQNSPFSALEFAIDHDQTLMSELSALNLAQEDEADLAGLRMAWRAGWPAMALAGYFKKLARADVMANADHDNHPAAARRWHATRALAEQLNASKDTDDH